jgi:hypothetical protein
MRPNPARRVYTHAVHALGLRLLHFRIRQSLPHQGCGLAFVPRPVSENYRTVY